MHTVFGIIPVPVILTNRMDASHAGCANGPLVRIRPQYADDRGLLEHELEHVRQFWRWACFGALACAALVGAAISAGEAALLVPAYAALLLGFVGHSLAYAMVKSYRLWSEVSCYRIQAAWYPDDRRPLFAQFVALNYRLDVSVMVAEEMLRDA